MALFWLEGYESNQFAAKVNANASSVASAGGRSSTTPRTDSLKGVDAYKVLFGAGDQDDLIILGSAYQLPGWTGERIIARLFGDARATTHLTVTIDATGAGNPATIKVYRGTTAGTLLGTSTAFTAPPSGTWMHIEIKARLHDSTGTVAVRLDETTILNLSGVDTKNGGTASVFDGADVVAGENPASLGNFTLNGYDDTYIANEQGSVNTDFQGAKRVETRSPTGNGNSSQGVGSDGNSTDNYLLIDEVGTISTADYVDFATTGDKDTYVHADSAQPTGNAVAGVFVWAYAQKSDAGGRTLIPVARLSGTESDGDALPLLNATYKFMGDVFETKPGGGAWTVSDINSAEFGVKAGA